MVHNFQRYLGDVVETYDSSHPHLRWGQAYINILADYAPNLVNKIVKDFPNLNPYYDDSKINEFLTYVSAHWGVLD